MIIRGITLSLVMSFWAQSSFAGCEMAEDCDKNSTTTGDVISTIAGVSTAIGGITTAVLVYSTTKDKKDGTTAINYIKKNNKSLRQHINVGHGKSLDDLVTTLNIEHNQEEQAKKAILEHIKEVLNLIRLDEIQDQNRAKLAVKRLDEIAKTKDNSQKQEQTK